MSPAAMAIPRASTVFVFAFVYVFDPWPTRAQQTDTIRLQTVLDQALAADPRSREQALQERASALRVRNIAAERLPSFSLEGMAQHQSDIPPFPLLSAPGQTKFQIPYNTYDSYLRVQQSLLDLTNQPRRVLERAQVAETQARLQSTLFALRQDVNTAFFTAALVQERAVEIETVIADLTARLREANDRVQAGTALRSEAATIEATLLQRRQDQLELRANRRAALEVLATLTTHPFADTDVLVVPDMSEPVTRARAALEQLRSRPEYAQFESTRTRLAAQEQVIAAQQKPRVSGYLRAGYGRPGLKQIVDEFDTYWLAGLQVQWRPWTWGTSSREREELEVQRQIASAEEAAFTRDLQRGVQIYLAAIDRLHNEMTMDDQIITLRERVEREARARFQERVITSAEYLDRRSDVLEARLARARHRVELAQAEAQFLTTLGLEVR